MFIKIMLRYFDNHDSNIYEDLYHIEHLDNFSHARVSYPSKWMVSFISEIKCVLMISITTQMKMSSSQNHEE